MISNTLDEKDCAIIISYSGDNPDVYPMKNIPWLEKNKVSIISITGGGDSYLKTHSKISISTSSREKLFSKISNFSSEESMMFILNVLYSKIFALNYETNFKTKVNRSRNLETERKTTFKSISESE